MKVLHFYRTYFPDSQGGLEEAIRQICLNTIPFGVESRVLTVSASPSVSPIELAEARVYQVKKHGEFASCSVGLGAIEKYRELAAWADVIHLHYPWPFADVVRLLCPSNKPSVLTYHSDIIRQSVLKRVYAPLEKRYLASIDAVVSTSPNYLAGSPTLQSVAEKVTTIPLGINHNSYPQVGDDHIDKCRLEYGSAFFLFVGVLRYYKGLHILLDAMVGSSQSLLIAGTGPMQLKLKRQAKRLGLSNVRFLGYVSDTDKIALLQLCRAVVLPSHLRSEAFGVTLLEAAMMGKPMISAEIGTGTSYVNIHGETGLVVKAGCCDALSEAMEELGADIQAAERMGVAAHRRYQKLFSGEILGENYRTLYAGLQSNNEVLSNRGR